MDSRDSLPARPNADSRWTDLPAVAEGSTDPNPYVSHPPTLPSSVPVGRANSPAIDASPRWWTSLAISGISLFVFILFSTLMAVVAVYLVHGRLTMELFRDQEKLAQVSRSRLGLMIMVVLPQLMLVVPAIGAAMLSPTPVLRRLGLVRGGWPWWAWLAAAVATPLVGLVSSIVVGLFMQESESLKEMTRIFRMHGADGFLLPLALMIGATPAICEELLFRGYVQTRLTRSFHPAIGIFVASFLFAAFHLDLVHVIAVFPMGLFLGWISWQSGSLFPAMIGHFVNNVISVFVVVLAPDGDANVLSAPAIAVSLSIIAAGILGMCAVMVAAVLYGSPVNPDSPIAFDSRSDSVMKDSSVA